MIVDLDFPGIYGLLPESMKTILTSDTTNWVKDIKKYGKSDIERAKDCSTVLLTLLKSTAWKHNPAHFNLASKLYKQVKKSKTTRKACSEEIKTIKALFEQFKTREMPKDIQKFEKKSKGHPNGTQGLSKMKELERKGGKSKKKIEKKAKRSVKSVHYFSQDERIKHLALFNNDGSMKLPKAVKDHSKLMYVVDKYGQFYVSEEKTVHKKVIKHSSFLKGHPVAGAGSLSLCPRTHTIVQITDSSGHYRPGKEELKNTLTALMRSGVDLAKVDVKYDGHVSKANTWDLA